MTARRWNCSVVLEVEGKQHYIQSRQDSAQEELGMGGVTSCPEPHTTRVLRRQLICQSEDPSQSKISLPFH